ncbi:hypothetical protein BKA67DRAFT_530222 [Truncatella angustata]|uniref:N-acetylglucosamine-induced protein 1 n=1 Tax=Truncatella angustata TaxID=152316 RepID=A0A9P9A1Z1_9PEZI|nr:uncharacterized protein BKA67DRAFT_530222 [Truncatella angustata]KAH6660106.1 hypothetical protein BKA67DRAFT_530222 [Truncatella angustata]KAH8202629.1 hypothetical protein TruAng_003230 [Truncatella angustata]
MGSLSDLPYWHVNVPEAERTIECPEFLRNLSLKDERVISTPDDQCHVLTWAEVQKIVAENRLDAFQRLPSDLRRYLCFNWKLKQDYGSVMNFVLNERLGWQVPMVPKGRPFEFDEDIKTLWNDWPYGLDKRIVHLVVWTKFELEDDPATDDLTDKARKEIDDYVSRSFGSKLSKDNYVWFKNWKSIKSVHAVEHFHVMLFDPDPEFIDDITNGDVPLVRKV